MTFKTFDEPHQGSQTKKVFSGCTEYLNGTTWIFYLQYEGQQISGDWAFPNFPACSSRLNWNAFWLILDVLRDRL